MQSPGQSDSERSSSRGNHGSARLGAEPAPSGLRGLATLNFLSRSVGILWPRIFRLARRLGRPVRILDVATGGGDIPLKLWRRAQKTGVQVDILGIDISPIALEVAQARAERERAALRFAQVDVLR